MCADNSVRVPFPPRGLPPGRMVPAGMVGADARQPARSTGIRRVRVPVHRKVAETMLLVPYRLPAPVHDKGGELR